ncbi:MAG: hypothetical protein KDC93_13810 [Cyclobacteriaceae bacterium]|nr:hypothetical protein [Cyclobacteriaceae bacterium]
MRSVIMILFLWVSLYCNGQSSHPIAATQYFEFYNNYWINLHHFLYQQAKGSQLKKLEEDGASLIDIGEGKVMSDLSEIDSAILNHAVNYYRDHLIEKSLFQLGDIRVGLQGHVGERVISDTTLSSELINVLNEIAPLYSKKFWPLHSAQNQKVVTNQIGWIKDLEEDVIKDLVRLSGKEWPDTKVRVDLTAYANFAGAYTVSRPAMNITISTLDPTVESSLFVETIFHEGTHLLFSMDSPFRSSIFFLSKELGIDFPRNLWHVSQFYLSGRVVQDHLKEKGKEHQLLMDVKNIFSNANTPDFRSALEEYYLGNADVEITVRSLLEAYK